MVKVMNDKEWLEWRNKVLLDKVQELEREVEIHETRNEYMRGALYFTFMLSSPAILLVIEQLLKPWLEKL